MKDERYKQIMHDLGMPDSHSLLAALRQVANEVAQEVQAEERERCAQIAWMEFADVCKKKMLNPCEKHNADWLVSGAIRKGANHD